MVLASSRARRLHQFRYANAAGSSGCSAASSGCSAASLELMNGWRINGSLRVTPAMEAGAADHVWSLEEVIALLD